MSRLTRKTNEKDYCVHCDYIEMHNAIFDKRKELVSPEEFYKEEPYQMEDGYYLDDAMNRLGKLEDLMDEYNINSIEQLENILSSRVIAGGFRSAGKTLVAKGMLYDILSEELGCPLKVVVRALNEGVYIEVEYLPDVIERPRLYYSDDFKCYCFELLFGEYIIKLSDYQKTWWLKGEK